MAKMALFVLALCLLFSLTYAARPGPVLGTDTQQTQKVLVIDEKNMELVGEESCEGVGEDECLTRRTLAAHTDYIYTQKKKNP